MVTGITKHYDDYSYKKALDGSNYSELARPYTTVNGKNILISEIIEGSNPVVDTINTKALKWMTQGTMNGSNGIYEIVINPETNQIYHYVFKGN